MSNYVIRNKDKVVSGIMSKEEAERKLEDLKMFLYPEAYLEATEKERPSEGFKLTAPPEEVEDVGCAGGACTL